MTRPTYEEWLATLSDAQRQKANDLLAQFRTFCADDPEGWVRSEISENFAQLARFLVLRSIWPESIDRWAKQPGDWIEEHAKDALRDSKGHFADAGLALSRMVEAGVAPADIGAVARMVAYMTAFDVVHRIDEGADPEASDDAPGWVLMEVNLKTDQLTGRMVAALHEDILSMDPTGREGRPE